MTASNSLAQWPFGEDKTCLAKIMAGSASRPTPKIIEIGNICKITKSPKADDPREGWHRVVPQAWVHLRQEKDPSSGLPFVSFMRDPLGKTAVAARANQKQKATELKHQDEKERFKAYLLEVLMENGVIKPKVDSTEPSVVAEALPAEAIVDDAGVEDEAHQDDEEALLTTLSTLAASVEAPAEEETSAPAPALKAAAPAAEKGTRKRKLKAS